jgi:hypothetical protein
MGIPPGYGFKKLLFCDQANLLVAHTQSLKNWRPERLFGRPIGSERYHSIAPPAEMISQDDPVLSPSHPLLAYNTMLHTLRLDGGGNELHGAAWEAVRVIDLRADTETHFIDRETLHLPDRETEVWVSQLLAFGERPETLHIVAAFKRHDSSFMEYYVAELHLQSGLVRPLVNLPAAFL